MLQRIQAGDEDALLSLHAQYANLVYSVVYRILNDAMSAEEVTQDTFLRLWNKADTFDPAKGQFVTWLLTVARRLAIDVLRQWKRREPRLGMLFIDEDPQLWEAVLRVDGSDELRRTLVSLVEGLPREQRDAIELAYFYGMTHSEIAEYLQVPLGTVKGRIRQGMQKLRTAWSVDLPVHPKEDC